MNCPKNNKCMPAAGASVEEFNLTAYLAGEKECIDGHLAKLMDTIPDTNLLKPAMAYSLLGGGKRMRPILCLAAARAVGVPFREITEPVLSTGCAIEFIHTYSLIHDDLPAMDDDNLRRGRKTCHIAFDEATAILAGDALLTQAFEILASPDIAEKTSPGLLLSIVHAIARAAGPRGMVAGQMLDLAAEGCKVSVDELQQLHGLKTGALIRVSLGAGAELGGASSDQREALKRYGQAIGLAYQIADDILNVEGDPHVLGKAVGTDAQRHKNTYPALLGLSASKALAQSLVDNALQALGTFDKKADPLRAIARYVVLRRY